MKTIRIAAALCVLMPGVALAQEAVVTQPVLTPTGAEALAEACIAWAAENHADRNIAVAVVDAGGGLMYYERMQGASNQTGVFALGKAETARQTGGLSGADLDRLTKDDPDLQVLTFGRLALQGGVAIRSPEGNVLLGAIGVSGLSSADDEACGQAAIAAVIG